MWLVKYYDRNNSNKEEFRRYKWKTEGQVNNIIKGMHKQGFSHVSTTKEW